MADVLFSREKQIGLITLNRPSSLNALTLPMILAMKQALISWAEDPGIQAVVIRQSPGKAFCAGGDVRWVCQQAKDEPQRALTFFKEEYQLNYLIFQYKKPYIALMDGITMGGGVGISLHGDYKVASSEFLFAMPETSIGFFPDIGASYLLSRLPHSLGIYLGLTGDRLKAPEAYYLELIDAIIAPTDLDNLLSDLIHTDLSTDRDYRIQRCLKVYHRDEITQQNTLKANESHIANTFRYSTVEAILTALFQDQSVWHQQTMRMLQEKSPTSLKVTLAQLLKASSLNMAECLQMDFQIVQQFLMEHDFYEGVRALLIDKDKSPKWDPKTLAEVTTETVAQYFEHKLTLEGLH